MPLHLSFRQAVVKNETARRFPAQSKTYPRSSRWVGHRLSRKLTAHWRSRLRIAHGKSVQERGAEPGTLVTGQVSGAAVAPWPQGRKPAGFRPFGWAPRPMGAPLGSGGGRREPTN